MAKSRKAQFGMGLAIGAVIGSVVAMFTSPKSGKENREWAKQKFSELQGFVKNKNLDQITEEVYGKVSTEGKALMKKAQKEFTAKMKEVKTSMKNMTKDDYTALVKEVVGKLSKEKEATQARLSKLTEYLTSKKTDEEMK